MTPQPPFEDQLADWMEDGPTSAPTQILDTVLAATPSIPQRRGAWRVPWRNTPMTGFARLLAVLAIAVGLGTAAVLVALRPGSTGVGGPGSPSASPAAVVATASPAIASAAATVAPTPVAATPAPTVTPTTAPCDTKDLAIRITLWEGAAGHRIAHLELTNTGAGACLVASMERPQLVDGHGSVLIDGPAPTSPNPTIKVAPGEVLKAMSQDGNYCGPAPAAPVSIAFVFPSGARIVATPVSATDTTVPPCNGPGQPADITMQPWAP